MSDLKSILICLDFTNLFNQFAYELNSLQHVIFLFKMVS